MCGMNDLQIDLQKDKHEDTTSILSISGSNSNNCTSVENLWKDTEQLMEDYEQQVRIMTHVCSDRSYKTLARYSQGCWRGCHVVPESLGKGTRCGSSHLAPHPSSTTAAATQHHPYRRSSYSSCPGRSTTANCSSPSCCCCQQPLLPLSKTTSTSWCSESGCTTGGTPPPYYSSSSCNCSSNYQGTSSSLYNTYDHHYCCPRQEGSSKSSHFNLKCTNHTCPNCCRCRSGWGRRRWRWGRCQCTYTRQGCGCYNSTTTTSDSVIMDGRGNNVGSPPSASVHSFSRINSTYNSSNSNNNSDIKNNSLLPSSYYYSLISSWSSPLNHLSTTYINASAPSVRSSLSPTLTPKVTANATASPKSRGRGGSSTHPSILTILFLLVVTLARVTDGCSSRSTPRPRPASPTMRPNITFQTYACPPAYAAWYCLNGATCFTVKIDQSILYNCECAEGYMGQRCEFKDLDGSYLPARESVLMQTASIAGGATVACVLVFIVLFAVYVFMQKDGKQRSRDDDDGRNGDRQPFSGYQNPRPEIFRTITNPYARTIDELSHVDIQSGRHNTTVGGRNTGGEDTNGRSTVGDLKVSQHS